MPNLWLASPQHTFTFLNCGFDVGLPFGITFGGVDDMTYTKMGTFLGTIRREHASYKLYIPKEIAELIGAKDGDKVIVQLGIKEEEKKIGKVRGPKG